MGTLLVITTMVLNSSQRKAPVSEQLTDDRHALVERVRAVDAEEIVVHPHLRAASVVVEIGAASRRSFKAPAFLRELPRLLFHRLDAALRVLAHVLEALHILKRLPLLQLELLADPLAVVDAKAVVLCHEDDKAMKTDSARLPVSRKCSENVVFGFVFSR